MNLFTIQWASTNLPKDQRYIIFNDGKRSAIYKRYFWIIYIRITKRYKDYDIYDVLLPKYKTLTKT
jgi:hypothetical protein